MIVILALAGVILVYAAWPSRGLRLPAQVPGGKWLDRAMDSVARAEPALGPEAAADRDEHVAA